MDKYSLQYGSDNKTKEIFGPTVRDLMNRSACTILVVSHDFLLQEWNNLEFREHVIALTSKNTTRLVCVQMHEVMDEVVEEHLGTAMRNLRFDRLQCDEIMFWAKLAFILFTNQPNEVFKNQSIYAKLNSVTSRKKSLKRILVKSHKNHFWTSFKN